MWGFNKRLPPFRTKIGFVPVENPLGPPQRPMRRVYVNVLDIFNILIILFLRSDVGSDGQPKGTA